VKDHYNQLEIRFRETSPSQREFEMSFRVYNEGVAFNYTFLPQPGKNELTLEKELTEFRLTGNYPAWVSDRAQSEYRKAKLNSLLNDHLLLKPVIGFWHWVRQNLSIFRV
jgi:alpha-glucosidase